MMVDDQMTILPLFLLVYILFVINLFGEFYSKILIVTFRGLQILNNYF